MKLIESGDIDSYESYQDLLSKCRRSKCEGCDSPAEGVVRYDEILGTHFTLFASSCKPCYEKTNQGDETIWIKCVEFLEESPQWRKH